MLDPGVAVAFGSASSELWELTQAPRQQLQADHEAAAALGRKAGKRSCKELREARRVEWHGKGLSSDDLALLGTLGSVLPALEELHLSEPAAGPDGVQRLAEKLGAGALPAVTSLNLSSTPVGDAGASALAAALGRGALPRLKYLVLDSTAIGDAGLVALAPALRRLPALEGLGLGDNPLGDEGLAALVAPPPPAGAPPPTTGGLTKLKELTSAAPRSPTPAAPPSPPRSTAARCRRSRSSISLAPVPAPRRRRPCCGRACGSSAGDVRLAEVGHTHGSGLELAVELWRCAMRAGTTPHGRAQRLMWAQTRRQKRLAQLSPSPRVCTGHCLCPEQAVLHVLDMCMLCCLRFVSFVKCIGGKILGGRARYHPPLTTESPTTHYCTVQQHVPIDPYAERMPAQF